jgi:Cu2+-exporting ATPase
MPSNHCYHCELPIYSTVKWYATINGVARPMCCLGCKSVAEIIAAGGFQTYYKNRTQATDTANEITDQLIQELRLYDRPDQQQSFVRKITKNNNNQLEANLLIQGISCAACVWLLENHLKTIDGIANVNISLSSHKAQIVWNSEVIKLSDIMRQVYYIGYKCKPWDPDQQYNIQFHEQRNFTKRLAVAGIGAMQVMMFAIAIYAGDFSSDLSTKYLSIFNYINVLFTTPVVFYSASPFFASAARAIKNSTINMDVSISLAIIFAYSSSLWTVLINHSPPGVDVYFDSICMFVFFLLSGRFLELKARYFMYRSSETLTDLLPKSCMKWHNGKFIQVAITDLQPNDLIRIAPGEIIPADGILISATCSVNEAIISGESLPVTKHINDKLLCASINTEQTIQMRVTKKSSNSEIAKALQLVNSAEQVKPKIANLATTIAKWFTSAVLLIATTVFLYRYFYADNALYIMLSVLVVTCPCALSLAIPVAITATTGNLNRLGLLITKSHVVESLNLVDTIVFDKTGTLTTGNLKLTNIQPIANTNADYCLKLAVSLEECYDHQIARAFKQQLNNSNDIFTVTARKNFVGNGIAGTINNNYYRLGTVNFASSNSKLEHPTTDGQWVLLTENNIPICWFNFADSLRPETKNVIKALKGINKQIIILSGDHLNPVTKLAKELGINHFYAQKNPEQKLEIVKKLQQNKRKVLMVGDGINDVPVLSVADVSLAMGCVANLNTSSADAILIKNNLVAVVHALYLAKKNHTITFENLLWAGCYNICVLPLAIMGMIAPWMAAIGMTLSSLLVITNSLRLINKKFPNLSDKQHGKS